VNVVVRVDDEPVSLLVDEIGGVLEVSQVPFEQTPNTVDERVRDLLLGAYTLPERLLLALNARQVLDVGQEGRAA
jgi:purine-binding chemotaxis protein CheW